MMKALALRNLLTNDPDFSSLRTDKNTANQPGLLPVGVNHTLALFDVMDQVDQGKIPGTDKMDKAGKEGFKKKLAEDYIKDMGDYGFTPEAAQQIYHEAKRGYKTNSFSGNVKEGLRWNKSQGVGDSNDEMRKKSRDRLVYRNFATGAKPYVFKDGVIDEPKEMTKTRMMVAEYLSKKNK